MVALVTVPVLTKEMVTESPSFNCEGLAVRVQVGPGGGGGGGGGDAPQSELMPQMLTDLLCAKLVMKSRLSLMSVRVS